MSQRESPVGPPLEFVAEPDQLREVPDELDDGPEGARADLGLAGRHAAKVHQADAGGRACPVRPRQAVHQDGVSFGGKYLYDLRSFLWGEKDVPQLRTQLHMIGTGSEGDRLKIPKFYHPHISFAPCERASSINCSMGLRKSASFLDIDAASNSSLLAGILA